MANNNTLKSDIRQYIYSNQNEEITGNILRDVLLEMVDTLGDGWTYKGVATTTTNPGTPDDNVFYIATAPGTYTNFGSLSVADGEVAILKYNGSWAKDVTGAATSAQVTQLGRNVIGIIDDGTLYDNTNYATGTRVGVFYPIDGFSAGQKIDITLKNIVYAGTDVRVWLCTEKSRWEEARVRVIASFSSGEEHSLTVELTETDLLTARYIQILSNANGAAVSFNSFVSLQGDNLKTLTERMTSMESSIQEKQNLLVSGINIKTIDGESILGSGNISAKTANFKYLFVENGIIVARPSGNQMFTIRLGAGGGNGLFDFREFGTLPLGSEIIEANIQRLHYSSSDWIAPFQIKAVNNIDGDDLDNITFTGGSHQYNNQITGSTPTARLGSVEYRIDGEIKTGGSGYGNSLVIVATEYIQGTNTKKADGTGREILKEIVTWSYDGDKWSMETELVPLEDIQMILWYGYQFTGIGSGLFEHWGYINGANRSTDAATSGNDKTIGMYAFGNCNLKMLVDTITDMGNRAFMTSGATNSAFKSGAKGYFFIANNNAILGADNHYFLDGSYEFSLPKVDIPVLSGSFQTSGDTISHSIPVSELENGNYYVIWSASGNVTPSNCNIYRTERNMSGLIQPIYTNILPGQRCDIEKTAATNYLWFYKNGLSSSTDATISYEIFQVNP